MSGEAQNGMQCAQFEALLADALDGVLSGPQMAEFRAHAASCPDCGPLYAGAQQGMSWLKSLPEVEPPRNLVRNILIATSGAPTEAEQAAPVAGWQWLRAWTRPVVAVLSGALQPRFALAVGMVFFSLAVLLDAAGVRLSSLRQVDLRPSTIQESIVRGYHETSARVIKYYENIRFVYEMESRVRDLRNAAREGQEATPPPVAPKPQRNNRDTSGQPSPRWERYVQRSQPTLALAPLGREPVLSTSHRRDA